MKKVTITLKKHQAYAKVSHVFVKSACTLASQRKCVL